MSNHPFDPERMLAIRNLGHSSALGIAYGAHGPDWAELALPYDDRLVGDVATGVLASGPILSLMDMATSISVWLRRGGFLPHATLDLRIDYLRAATPGKTVIGRGECYRLSRSVAFIRGHAHDGDPDDLVAHVAGTFMVTGAGGMTLPPYATMLGMVHEVDERGLPRLAMPFADVVLGRPGFLHGGAIGGLMEMAAILALRHALGDDAVAAKPVNLTVDYMRGGRDHDTRAQGTVRRLGTRIANVDSVCWQDDPERPIALARLTFLLRR